MTLDNSDIRDKLAKLDITLQDHQEEALADAARQVENGRQLRLCLYHRTGAGKTITSLVCAAQAGVREVLVMAPPITHHGAGKARGWVEWGEALGISVTPISHAKFRQKDYKVGRSQAIIVDEFHLLGGHTGNGWKKLDRLAKGLQAPLIICSATPNYNDAERVYCVMHVMAPETVKGGYLQFLYSNCETTVNPFGQVPIVDGFRDGSTAEEFLARLPYVHYVEDEAIKQVVIGDIPADVPELPETFTTYGYDRRNKRILASQMEERHRKKRYQLLAPSGAFRHVVYSQIAELVGCSVTPVLLYCDSSEIALALHTKVQAMDASSRLITGATPAKEKLDAVRRFTAGELDVLVGTATMATGLDGVDKMCDTLIIVDDTDDDAKRRQLMGRILPRGLDTDVSKKQVWRLTYP